MKRILLRSTMVTALSVMASLALGATIIPALGGSFDRLALIMCIVCPVLIAFPVSVYTCRNRQILAAAHDNLKKAHSDLAAAHGELEAMHAELTEKARRDHMTGMLNREAFLAEVEAARRRPRAGTLLIIDADNFKTINDDFGHPAGDDALLKIAAAIGRSVREGDLLGRIGGEEFGVLLAGADRAESARVAERIRNAVETIAFMPPGAAPVPLTVSIGAAPVRPEASLSDVMREADKHLYAAKRDGRNRVVLPEVSAAA